MCVSHSVVSDSLWPHGLQPTRLLCSWDSPDKNTGVGSYFLLRGMFLTQGSNPGLLHCRQILYHLSHQKAPRYVYFTIILSKRCAFSTTLTLPLNSFFYISASPFAFCPLSFPNLLSGKALINSRTLRCKSIMRLGDLLSPGIFLLKQKQKWKIMVMFWASEAN